MEYISNDYNSISNIIKTKSAKEVEEYSKEYFSRANTIPELSKDYRKIMKKQENFQKEAKLVSL